MVQKLSKRVKSWKCTCHGCFGNTLKKQNYITEVVESLGKLIHCAPSSTDILVCWLTTKYFRLRGKTLLYIFWCLWCADRKASKLYMYLKVYETGHHSVGCFLLYPWQLQILRRLRSQPKAFAINYVNVLTELFPNSACEREWQREPYLC